MMTESAHGGDVDGRGSAGWRGWLIAAVLGGLFTAAFALWWPCEVVFDDGGIVLKYLDNFADGHFYSYNPEDGPIFGISGFLHGLLAGGLAWTGWLSPDASARAVNTAGLFLAASATLLIVRHFVCAWPPAIAGWMLVLVSSHRLLSCAFQALEAPLHLGIAALTILMFLERRTWALWAGAALLVISKLDGVPIVGGIVIAEWLRRHGESGRWWVVRRRDAVEAALCFGLPLLVWVVFCFLVFGSPLPHTAEAKLMLHRDKTGSLFPFLVNWAAGDRLRFGVVAALLGAALAIPRGAGKARLRRDFFVLIWAWIGLMGLYLVYNPNEKMPWYYCIPEWLLALAAAVAVLMILGADAAAPRSPRRSWAASAVLLALALAATPLLRAHLWLMIGYTNRIEPERVAVGEWVRRHADGGDRLLTHSGLVARHSGLYTYDSTGLNTDLVLATHRRRGNASGPRPGVAPDLVPSQKPDWVAQTSLLPPAVQTGSGYELVHSAYNMPSEGAFPAWRVFRRMPDGDGPESVVRTVAWENVLCDDKKSRGAHRKYVKARGHWVCVTGLAEVGARELVFGLRRADPALRVTMQVLDRQWGALREDSMDLQPRDRFDFVHGFATECKVPLAAGADKVVVTVEPVVEGCPIEVVDPILRIPVAR